MWLEILAISLWGGLVALDTTAALQILISHPLVSCSIVGLILGNFSLGFIIGIVLELVWLNEIPVGAAPFAEGNIGATVAASVAIMTVEQTTRSSAVLFLSLMIGVLISVIGGRLVIFIRSVNSNLYHQLISDKALSVKRIAQTHYAGIFFSFILGFFLTMTSVLLFAKVLFPPLIHVIPERWDPALDLTMTTFLGVGCGVLFYMFFKLKKWWLIGLGLLGGVFSGFLSS
jgi:mannose/fructose/N-acetylgalactosamine-specific phosphotransferase system component IIC